jgi:hypothetical protein
MKTKEAKKLVESDPDYKDFINKTTQNAESD